MTGLTWILTVTCVAGCCLSGASPVLRSAQRVQVGQNVSLSCNLTSSAEITWYLLRSDQLLPLLTVRSTKLRGDTTNTHAAPDSRIQTSGDLEEGSVSLEILEVEEKDAGLYFCTGRCRGTVCVNRGIYLTVNGEKLQGVNGAHMKQPCWSLGICVLPGLLSLCFVFITGLYLCSGVWLLSDSSSSTMSAHNPPILRTPTTFNAAVNDWNGNANTTGKCSVHICSFNFRLVQLLQTHRENGECAECGGREVKSQSS
ncbi:hypothetical protein EXN66_Car000014 [Channa argus]|uniref:Ig-like domain-containing protein n=1 Tax=Channa argus TaxID=215402 RepID=A0A6G1QWH2_CHAAH|nr:hypothetical protein EXN66_Car000014 [Channa argus]